MVANSPAKRPSTGLDLDVRPQRELDLMSAELSSRRSGLSFQRTRMSADRTLMSIMRTSLSLIGFGFTLFSSSAAAPSADQRRRPPPPRNPPKPTSSSRSVSQQHNRAPRIRDVVVGRIDPDFLPLVGEVHSARQAGVDRAVPPE